MKYHFTNRVGWDGIRAAQQIALSTVNVNDGELPVVWFSLNPTWDYSARANLNLTLDVNGRRIDYKLSFQELCNGLSVAQYQIDIPPTELFRISVKDEIAPITWEQYRMVSNTPAQILSMMEQEKGAAPQEWFGSRAIVPREHWQAVHRWDSHAGAWQEFAEPW